jgi:hypothetical protein
MNFISFILSNICSFHVEGYVVVIVKVYFIEQQPCGLVVRVSDY